MARLTLSEARELYKTFSTRELEVYRAALVLDQREAERHFDKRRGALRTILFCAETIRIIDDVLSKRSGA